MTCSNNPKKNTVPIAMPESTWGNRNLPGLCRERKPPARAVPIVSRIAIIQAAEPLRSQDEAAVGDTEMLVNLQIETFHHGKG